MYTAASGALVAQLNVDVIANNLANANTGGFKRTVMQVQSTDKTELYRIQTDPGTTPGRATPGRPTVQAVGPLGFGSQVYDTPAVFEQGGLEKTDNRLNLALSGPGFFAIQTPQGLRYTRQGDFVRSQQGILTSTTGDLVLGRNGAIPLPNTANITIDQQGGVFADGVNIDALRVTEFANLRNVRPEGNSRFIDANAGPQAATQSRVMQGYREQSNGNVVRSMVDLITNQRWFDANQKVIQNQDETTASAINDVGRSR